MQLVSWGTLREGYHWSHLPSIWSTFSALRLISAVVTNIYWWLKEKKLISLIAFPGWCHYIITRHNIAQWDKNPNCIRKSFLSRSSCRTPVALRLKQCLLMCRKAMPGFQRCISSACSPLKPQELAPQFLWEAKEITLLLNIGPLFLVADVNTTVSLNPKHQAIHHHTMFCS